MLPRYVEILVLCNRVGNIFAALFQMKICPLQKSNVTNTPVCCSAVIYFLKMLEDNNSIEPSAMFLV